MALRRDTRALVLRRFFSDFSCLQSFLFLWRYSMVVIMTKDLNDVCLIRLRRISCVKLRYSSHVVDIEVGL